MLEPKADMPNVAEPNAAGPHAGEAGNDPSAATELPLMELVAAARAGSADAAETLAARLRPSVLRLARALAVSEDEAAEVAQETFLHVFAHLADFRQESGLGTWIHRIVVNTALMRARQRARRPWDAVATYGRFWEHEPEAIDSEGSGLLAGRAMGAAAWALRPDEGAIDAQTRQRIESALGQLPERYRAVFVLRQMEGHDTDTVAEMLGITQPTVKARLLRARGFLRHALTAYRQTKGEGGGGQQP